MELVRLRPLLLLPKHQIVPLLHPFNVLSAIALVVANTLTSFPIVLNHVMRRVLRRIELPFKRLILGMVHLVRDPFTKIVRMANHSFVTSWVPTFWTRSKFARKR